MSKKQEDLTSPDAILQHIRPQFAEACAENNPQLVKTFIESGEDATKRDLANLFIEKPDGSAIPLFYEAATNGRHEIVRLLLPWINDSVLHFHEPGCNYDALFKTCYDGHTEVVKLLLEDGRLNPYIIGDIDGNSGFTPLYAACYQKHHEIAALLIADPRVTDLHYIHNVEFNPEYLHQGLPLQKSNTAFDEACCTDNDFSEGDYSGAWVEFIKLFLNHPRFNASREVMPNRSNPLHTASLAYNSNDIATKLLLEHKEFDPNAINENGDAPIHIAIRNLSIGVVRGLLSSNRVEKTSNGINLLHVLFTQNDRIYYDSFSDILDILLKNGVDANVEIPDSDQESMLHRCCQNRCFNGAEKLLIYGAKSTLRGELQELPDELLNGMRYLAAIFYARLSYPDKMESIGTPDSRAELAGLEELVTVEEGVEISEPKTNHNYEQNAIYSAQSAFIKAKAQKVANPSQVALAVYFQLMEHSSVLDPNEIHEIFKYRAAILDEDGENKNLASALDAISEIAKGGAQTTCPLSKLSEEIIGYIINLYLQTIPEISKHHQQSQVAVTTASLSSMAVFPAKSAKIIADAVKKFAEDRSPKKIADALMKSITQVIEDRKPAQVELATSPSRRADTSKKIRLSIAGTVADEATSIAGNATDKLSTEVPASDVSSASKKTLTSHPLTRG